MLIHHRILQFEIFLNYDTILAADIKLLTKSDKATTYLNYDVDVFFYEFYKLE